jgi:hypothetical protein
VAEGAGRAAGPELEQPSDRESSPAAQRAETAIVRNWFITSIIHREIRASGPNIERRLRMRTTTRTRSLLALGLLLSLALPTFAADAAKDVESTPQAKVYRASLKAIATGDYDAYAKCMTSEAVKEIEAQTKEMGKTTKDGMEMMKAMAPSDVKLTNLKVDGKKAVLSATGKQDKEVMYGSIDLEEEKGQWKVGKQSWTNKK